MAEWSTALAMLAQEAETFLEGCESVWVSPEMCEIVQAAIPGLPEWTLRSSDLLIPKAYVWFTRPIDVGESESLREPRLIRAMAWNDWGHGPTMSFRGDTGQWRSTAASQLIPPMTWFRPALAMLATTLLCHQTITLADRRSANRAARKLAERRRGIASPVLVVTLRRAVRGARSKEPADVEWANRWWVRTHWRHYDDCRCSRCGGAGRLPVLIPPHVKGPADMPLHPATERVFALVR